MSGEVQPAFDDELDAVLEEIRRALKADPFFADIPAMVDDDKDLVSDMQKALDTYIEEGGRNGTSVVIEVPDLDVLYPNVKGPQFDEITIDINVVENVLINRGDTGTGKTARRIAKRIAKILHHRPVPGLQKVLLARKVLKKPDNKYLIYAARFTTGGLVLKK